MILRTARKELTDTVRDGRFRWAALLVGALLLVALGAGWMHVQEARAQHETARATAREHWDSQGDKNPHSAAHYGIYAFKPRLPLSFVDQGVDPYTGTSVWLEAHRQNDFVLRAAQDASAVQRFASITAAGVLQQLIPLLIILLSFGALAFEREQGTLRQILALGVPRKHLAWGKALGTAGALALLLVPAAALGAAAVVGAGGGASGATLGRAAILTLAYLGYFSVWVALSLAVSAKASSARTALVVLLAVWSVNGLVAPRVAVDLSKSLYPTPSAFEFAHTVEREMANGVDDIRPPDREAITARLLEEHGVERVDDLPVNPSGITLQESEEFGNRIYDRNYEALWDAFERQSRVHDALAVLAPGLAVRALSMGLAGTDVEQHRHFASAAEDYRRDLMRAMNMDLALNSRAGETYLADDELWESQPPFDYEAPSLAWVLGNRRLSALVLLFWVVGAAAAAAFGVRRMEVG